MQLRERLTPAEPVAELVPPLDVAFTESPAQPDLPARDECRKVDQTGLDLAKSDSELVDPGHAGLHLVDHSLHPEAEDADLGVAGGWVLGGIGRVRASAGVAGSGSATGSRLGRRRRRRIGRRAVKEDLVAETDQLGTLAAQRLEDRPDLRDQVVRFV